MGRRDEAVFGPQLAYGLGQLKGVEHASWHSVGSPDFAPGDRSMTYRWEGLVDDYETNNDPDRTGVASFNLNDDPGLVEHVGMGLKLEVQFRQVSAKWLKEQGFNDCQPDDLKANQGLRNGLARAYAASLPPRAVRVAAKAG
jgi:hypothetical protein